MTIADNLKAVRKDIDACARACGRNPESIVLVAVSKTRTLREVTEAQQAGQRHFGENTIQDALTKIPYLQDTGLEWHFIGHLQSKKANKIPGHFQWVHSVDSMKLAQKLDNAMQRAECAEPLNCLIQINVSGEVSKSGIEPGELAPFIDAWLEADFQSLTLRGLMTIGVQGSDKQTREAFRQLKVLRDDGTSKFGLSQFDQLSMGMSHDYRVAIEEGATLVRVGTAIFGQRASATAGQQKR